ncbi:hypothetical protein NL515_11200 [Pseudomonas donghuensis]|nr:hypothetical protein [Pseudomonas donghuensis]MCP6691980.1 hypothetical protein [Pseudomonas donghuensis]
MSRWRNQSHQNQVREQHCRWLPRQVQHFGQPDPITQADFHFLDIAPAPLGAFPPQPDTVQHHLVELVQAEQALAQTQQPGGNLGALAYRQGLKDLDLDFQVAEVQRNTVAAGTRMARQPEQLGTQLTVGAGSIDHAPDPVEQLGAHRIVLGDVPKGLLLRSSTSSPLRATGLRRSIILHPLTQRLAQTGQFLGFFPEQPGHIDSIREPRKQLLGLVAIELPILARRTTATQGIADPPIGQACGWPEPVLQHYLATQAPGAITVGIATLLPLDAEMPLGAFDQGTHLAPAVCSGTCQQHAGRPARQMFERVMLGLHKRHEAIALPGSSCTT